MVGLTIGHYRIAQPLGRGGMGEVYEAEDTRLHRRVALKVLAPSVAASPGWRERFEREAQSVAALNHPGIVTIYSVEQAGDVHFLTMELIEGSTLAALIRRDGFPLDRLLQLAVPLADAVGAAHARGIVHRDLKPANVMVTPEGRVKVLDFGLAKAKAPVALGEELTTLAAQELTGEGQILGTVAYMSPEQAEGREVDHRSDIFSLGVLLYELATGERPFKGSSNLAILSSILKDTPRPVTEFKAGLPIEVGRVIRRCLAKDPARRYQSAVDLRNELEEIRQELESGELTTGTVVETRRPRARLRRAAVLIAGIAGVFAAIGTVYLGWYGASDRPPVRMARFPLQPPPGVRIGPLGAPSVLAISHDGEWVAFRGTSEDRNREGLYLRSTAEVEGRFVQGSQGGHSPFFSPDNQWLGFFANGAIQKVAVGGGQPQRICRVPRLRGASWGEDGHIVFSTGEGLLRVSAEGGEPVPVTRPAAGESHYWPQVLPGSQAAVFTLRQGASDSWRKIAVVSLATGQIRAFTSLSGGQPRYLPSGHLVFSRVGALYVVGFDLRRLELTGEARNILDDIYLYRGSGYSGFDVAASGSLAYIPGAERIEDAELVWLDRAGKVLSVLPDRRPYHNSLALSPDGDRLAVSIRHNLEDSDLWVYDLARGGWTRLTFAPGDVYRPVWSPDGKWIVFSSFESGHPNLFRVLADGSGTPEQLTTGVKWDHAGDISPDGKVLLFMRETETAQWDLLSLRLEPRSAPEPFLATPVLEAWPAFSPDGRWVAYESDETGRREIHVRPYPGPGSRVTVSTNGGWRPWWSRNGRELFHVSLYPGKSIWAVPAPGGAAFRPGPPRLLFQSEFLGDGDDPWLNRPDVSPDGSRFVAIRHPRPQRTERLLVYVPNWMEQLRQTERSPVKTTR